MTVDQLRAAFASTRGVLVAVTADQLDQPTPCASWTVRDLIDHLVGISFWSAETISTGVAPEQPPTGYADGDFVAAFDDGIAATLAACDTPGAFDGTVRLPFGEFPAVRFLGLATTDPFVHGWDLAKATGQPTDLDPVLAEQLLTQARASIPDTFRGPDGTAPFGPIVDVPAGAPPADQLAGFLGRNP